ncbi:sulfotransferase [Salinisphaera sp. SPP-AMP-43]|uniref:sulfotransferase n=1 Tax=Salinisphaera sp. SPP-AMP-43 TaxID=3121288 RepID=UPI003C6E94A3
MFAHLRQRVQDKTRRLSYRRKARVFCVGTAKSGTHSIDTMFDRGVRTSHEPADHELLSVILEQDTKEEAARGLGPRVRERVEYLCLDVDSSQLNFFILDALLAEYPDARFLLPIREPKRWLRSFIDDSLRRETTPAWQAFRDLRFGSDTPHPPEEAPLARRGLYTLDGYLAYWHWHNHCVLERVPEQRLLVFPTRDIDSRARQISRFCGIDEQHVNPQGTHAFKNDRRFGVLEELDPDYLQSKIDAYFDSRLQALVG